MSAGRLPILRRLLAWILPPGPVRDGLLGDLDELYAERVRRGVASADRWYVRQVLSAAVHYPPRRMLMRGSRGKGMAIRTMDGLARDLGYALRTLRRSPGFAAVAVLTLAIGIGATTSLFTALDAILLRPLAAPAASDLAYLASGSRETFSFPIYERLRATTGSFSGFAAVQYGAGQRELIATGTASAEPESVLAQAVTGNFFMVLGVPALVGRTLRADDDRTEAAQPVVVISHAFWERRFGRDAAVLGRVVRLDDVTVTIVGVMPEGFVGFEIGAQPDLWFPVQLVTRLGARDRSRLAEGVEWLVLFGRLRPDVTRDLAQAELSALVYRQAEEQVARTPDLTVAERERLLNQTIELHSGATGYVAARSRFRQPLLVLMAAVVVVLLIACTNVAGLLLARGAARQREFAMRAALGAGRGRMIRQLVTESLLLAAIAGALGLAFARWGTSVLSVYLAQSGETAVALEPDGRVLLFTIGVSLLTGLLFGLAPAWRLSRLDPIDAIRQGSRTATRRARLQPMLVVAQVALSVLLLAGAGLFARTLHNLRTLDFGFRTDNLLLFSLDPGRWRPADPAERSLLLERVRSELETLTGVRTASIGGAGMLSGNGYRTLVAVDGDSPLHAELSAAVVHAGPRFFETLGVALLRGRDFAAAESAPPPAREPARARVVILGETLARILFGDADPIGRHVTPQRGPLDGVRLEVIGVVRDTRYSPDLREQIPLELYLPFFDGGVQAPPILYVRTDNAGVSMAAALRGVVARVEPRVAIRDLRTMNEVIDRALVRERISAQLVVFFGAFALLLASLGVYGLLSYGVTQQTRAIGVRLALGAPPRDVMRLVIGRGLTLAIMGSALGIGAALVATRFIAGLLYDVRAADPFTMVAVVGLLLAIASAACWLPARRALKVDPIVALRTD